MSKNYKVIQYQVKIYHKSVETKNVIRYKVVDLETGKVLDDANGYGYKTAQKAHMAYAYKTRDKSKDEEKKQKIEHIKKWLKSHRSFVENLDDIAFQILKGSMAPEDKIDSKFVKELLNEYDLHPDFTAGELLRVWRKL